MVIPKLSKEFDEDSQSDRSHIDVKDKKENKSSNPFNGEIVEVSERFEDSLPEDHPKVAEQTSYDGSFSPPPPEKEKEKAQPQNPF